MDFWHGAGRIFCSGGELAVPEEIPAFWETDDEYSSYLAQQRRDAEEISAYKLNQKENESCLLSLTK